MRVPLCRGLAYNNTAFPNFFNHETQDEAVLEVQQFYPLVQVNCSSYLTLFLCSLYAPICTELFASLPPCQELCTQVRDGCRPLMLKFGFKWPKTFLCDKFPKFEEGGICIGVPLSTRVNTAPPTIGKSDNSKGTTGKKEKKKLTLFFAMRDKTEN